MKTWIPTKNENEFYYIRKKPCPKCGKEKMIIMKSESEEGKIVGVDCPCGYTLTAFFN